MVEKTKGMTVLIVVGHCDDETQGAAGTIRWHVDRGDEVYGMYFTDGVGARYTNRCPEWIIEASERQLAAEAAAESLGFEWIRAGDFPDNALDTVGELALARWLEEAIEDIEVDRVYTNYMWDGNQDHRIVSRAVRHVFRPIRGRPNVPIWEMEVPRATENALWPFAPNKYVELTPGLWEEKELALRCYDMELTDSPDAASMEMLDARARWRGMHVGVKRAEAFVCRREVML